MSFAKRALRPASDMAHTAYPFNRVTVITRGLYPLLAGGSIRWLHLLGVFALGFFV